MANRKNKNNVLFYIAIIIMLSLITFTFFILSKNKIENFKDNNHSLNFNGYVKFFYLEPKECDNQKCKKYAKEWDNLVKKIKEKNYESKIYTNIIRESEQQQSYQILSERFNKINKPVFILSVGNEQYFVYDGKISAEEILQFIINTSNKY